jgi:Bifunctional DNA primase/polymerase, N-terminal/Primase C terminal 1 (PriCT-1)
VSGAFAAEALNLRALGLAPIPCSANDDDDGKTPAIAFKNWTRRPGAKRLHELALRFPEANVGILTGLSRIFVVDIDQARLVEGMIRRFGATPLMVETPSGGIHLYYRASGERCGDLRRTEQLPVDLKGIGGFIVVPPSVRPAGEHAGKLYRIVEGTWEDVARLPTIKPGSLPAPATAQQGRPDRIQDGVRHNELFRHGLREVKACDTLDAFVDRLRWINERSCDPPLPDADVVKTACSAWNYEQEGKNYVGRGKFLTTPAATFKALISVPGGCEALALHMLLRSTHKTGTKFAVAPKAMARDRTLPGWSHVRVRKARNILVDGGVLKRVSRGGSGPGDPALFCFAEDAAPGQFSLPP